MLMIIVKNTKEILFFAGLMGKKISTKEHNYHLSHLLGLITPLEPLEQPLIQIDDKRLTIAIATTGGKMMRNMKNWINYTWI